MRSVSVPRAGDHDDRRVALSPQRAGDIAAVAVGQVQVQQHEVGIDSSAISIALATVAATMGSNPPGSAFENGSKIDGSTSTNKIRGPVTRATGPPASNNLEGGADRYVGRHRSRDRRATGEERLDGLRTARDKDKLSDLAEQGCKTLPLDVEDEQSMKAAVAEVEQAEGAIGVLINNAGYSQSGAVESVLMDKVRKQFETNVFGLVRMTQLVLPKMREQGFGRIVNISSMGGFVFPGGVSTTRPSTRSRRSPTPCATRSRASAWTSS